MTEKATETLPNPVASFGGEGDKGCVVNYLENFIVMDPRMAWITRCCEC